MKEKTKKLNSYTSEFKESAVKLAIETDQPVSQTARELGTNKNGTHLITTLSNSQLTEVDTWKRVDDLSTKPVAQCNEIEPEVSTYNNGVMNVPNLTISDGFGGTLSHIVVLELVPFNERITFELINAEKK